MEQVTIEKRIINGKEREVKVIANGVRTTKNPEEIEKPKKRTVKVNETKESLLNELLEFIETKDTEIFKVKSSYAFQIGEQWLTLSLSANREKPKDLKPLDKE